jgi:tripartite-type tricarboxylate transporter receptor subunit TctC
MFSMLFTPNSAVLLAPLVQKMSFDPDKGLTPVTNVGTGSQVMAVKRSLPVNNLAEFLAYAAPRWRNDERLPRVLANCYRPDRQ